ncbi:MAG: putative DNA-binding domain-containing protein [Methylococcaceae bacterium]|jgi:hypothetical protein
MKNSMHKADRLVDFRSKQAEFAAYIRDPENNPAPADVKEQRMAMYRELFFNNIEGFLSGNFPVLRKILSDQQWLALAQDFFAKHPCQSPYFSQIPEEFLDYLQNERDSSDDLPFILELAHYEWVEMALSIAREDVVAFNQDLDNLLNRNIALSPLAWPLAYQYPVQKIAPAFLPLEAPEQATFLIVYRNREDDVNFIEITPITYRLLEIIQEHENPLAEDCLKQVARESNHPDPEFIVAGGLQILKELADKTIITLVL